MDVSGAGGGGQPMDVMCSFFVVVTSNVAMNIKEVYVIEGRGRGSRKKGPQDVIRIYFQLLCDM